MTTIVLYDDVRARRFEPFALTRPLGEMRAGAALVRHRWEGAAGRASGFIGAPHLATFEEGNAPPVAAGVLEAGTIVVNTRFAPALDARLGDQGSWRSGERIAAVRLAAPLPVAQLADGTAPLESLPSAGAVAEIGGWWIDESWDFIAHLPAMLAADIPVLGATGPHAPPAELTVLGEHTAYIAAGAYIEPFVLADTTGGPILVRRGARVAAFTRLVGPCVVGEDSMILGGKVTGCSIGDHARVHGEISSSIVIGHANKSHDGFVGHSIIGRWANLGAGTITSNLKNSYGTVALWTPDGARSTGLQFLGSFIGDHAKTGIGTRLTTGCVIGAGANVFGSEMPPKFVPPFAWGDRAPFAEFELDRFLTVAERVMKRRGVALSEGMQRMLTAAWNRRGAYVP